MNSRRVCNMAGCYEHAYGDLILEKTEYSKATKGKKSRKLSKRVGRICLCKKHFRDMFKFFGNYHGLIKSVDLEEELNDD